MAFQNEFYITLPSNASMDHFPDNKAGAFKTRLAQHIHLRGRWEVAVAEIHYPRTWKNIQAPLSFTVYWRKPDAAKESFDAVQDLSHEKLPGAEEKSKAMVGKEAEVFNENLHFAKLITLPGGHYNNINDVIRVLNEQLPDEKAEFFYDKHTGKVDLIIKQGFGINMDNAELRQMLGFNNTEFSTPGRKTSHWPADVNRGFYHLYIYSNIVTAVLVGDTSAPLLKVVALENTGYGSMIAKTFDRMHYVPLSQNHFEVIEINIANDQGKNVQFDFGKVVVKLHFRPRRLPYM